MTGSPGAGATTVVAPETITFDVRMDATDAMARGDTVAIEYGVLPALSVLESMAVPQPTSPVGPLLQEGGFGFGNRLATAVLVLVWGRQRSVPVRITQLDVQEVEFNPRLTMAKEASILGTMLWNLSPETRERLMLRIDAGLASGVLNPVVGRELPLAEAADAHRAVLAAGAAGKIVLVP
jgi:hypothetical protein